ncbi:MAG: LytTR family transcriptional regulator DNA-binding domain-containing protein [Bacteroidales bacterium]|nr:LytTR family transcriptional regulator DNA-binding domain-containing protein [Bacteroidales bacterium]
MPDKIKVLVIDDEALARDLVKKYLDGIPDVEVLGECENGFEALKMVQELQPDLLFLDIQMPKIDGFELLEVLDPKPEIIFTTAFDQYAIRAFEMNAVDYLLKPFSRERFIQALEKARLRIGTESRKAGTPSLLTQLQNHLDDGQKTLERVITRLGSKITVIPVEKILYIEAADDYVMIHSELGNHLKERTMKYFEAHLPADRFIRIHRSYIVNISSIKSLELYSKDAYLAILHNGDKLKVSAEGYKRLREKF